MKEIEQNLLKTQHNIDELEKRLTPRSSEIQMEMDDIVDET